MSDILYASFGASTFFLAPTVLPFEGWADPSRFHIIYRIRCASGARSWNRRPNLSARASLAASPSPFSYDMLINLVATGLLNSS